MNQKKSSPMTLADGLELIEKGRLLIDKMSQLIDSVSLPESETDPVNDPSDQIVRLLTEIVRGQQSQQEWIEGISEKLDALIEDFAGGAS
jgi:hypothetical protein